MTITDELNDFIAQNGGNARDALNVALARLKVAEQRIARLESEAYNRQDSWNDEGSLRIIQSFSTAP